MIFKYLTRQYSLVTIGSLVILIALVGSNCKPPSPALTQKPNCPHTNIAWDSIRNHVRASDTLSLQAYMDCLEGALAHLQDTINTLSPRDWLSKHPESGQTFIEYTQSAPVGVDSLKKYIYLQKIGPFDTTELRLMQDIADYLSIFFNLPTKTQPSIPLTEIPEKAKRKNPIKGNEQLQSIYLLNRVLSKQIPADASVCIGFTVRDLYPSEQWNYVFGQASLRSRVGVWSIYRFGKPSFSEEAYMACLKRALKTATHETGHMYSIKHCTAYNCNMSGSNHLEELDRRPLWYCPQCLGKISWNLNINEIARLEKLKAFWDEHHEPIASNYYQQALNALQGN